MKIILILILLMSKVYATTYAPKSLGDYYQEADIVARVFIKKVELFETMSEGQRVHCGLNVTARTVESFKGGSDDLEFSIQGMLFRVGSDYLVFLNASEKTTKEKMISTNSFSQNSVALQEKACTKKPNAKYKANWLNVSEFVSRYFNEKKSVEYWITPGYNVGIPKDTDVIFKKIELRSLIVDGEVIEDKYWSYGNPVPIPTDFWLYSGAFEWESYKKLLLSIVKKEDDNQLPEQLNSDHHENSTDH